MFRRAAPPPAQPAAPSPPDPQPEAPRPRRPRPAKPKDDDAALLAELGITQPGADDEADEVAALLKALNAADDGNSEEAALMASLENAKEDEQVDAVLRELGVRDGVLPPEVMSRRLDPAASVVEVERLEAAVQAAKRQAVEFKVAGNMEEARAKLRESKALQQALDELMAALNTEAQTEPDLLQELEAISTQAAAARSGTGGGSQPRPPAANRVRPTAAPAVPRAPPSPSQQVPGAQTLRDELRALKREIVMLRDTGKTAEAKAKMPQMRELERKIAESQG